MLDRVLDESLVVTGIGALGGMVGSSILKDTMATISPEYAGELASGGLVVLGSTMAASRDRNIKRLGMGVGTAGVAFLAGSLFEKLTGTPIADRERVDGALPAPDDPGGIWT